MPLTIIRNDITKLHVDAIVNAANTDLKAGGGVCGAIFNAAGVDKLQKACDKLAPIKTGEAVITKGYALPAEYIVHTAGPVYRDGRQGEEKSLRSCYTNALDLAKKNKCNSIAFPLISSGIYGYPKDEALRIATASIGEWLMKNDMDVSLVVFDKTAFMLSNDILGDVKAFIDENYVDEQNLRFGRSELNEFNAYSLSDIRASEPASSELLKPPKRFRFFKEESAPAAALPSDTFDDILAYEPLSTKEEKLKSKKPDKFVDRLDEPFSASLLRLIEAKGKTDIEVYKRANLDRKLFSKIRTGKGYMPSKKTAVALAVALELSLSETRDLLEKAGFALSRSVIFDVIIEYFISHKLYDIFEINNVLFEYDQPLLGG